MALLSVAVKDVDLVLLEPPRSVAPFLGQIDCSRHMAVGEIVRRAFIHDVDVSFEACGFLVSRFKLL